MEDGLSMWHNMRKKQLIGRKHERKRLFRRHRREWKDNIEVYLREVPIECCVLELSCLRRATTKSCCVDGNGSSASIKY